jgi:TPR repeat protein
MIATARNLENLSRWAGRTLAVLFFLAVFGPLAWAGDWEDGYASYMGGDYETAFGLFKSAAEEGSVQAMDMLSIMYRNGQGVAPDYAEASLWSERAKAQRSSDEIVKLQGSNNAGSNK